MFAPPSWNDHETLLLQIEGRKQWSLFQPTEYYPVGGMDPLAPKDKPRWSGNVGAGDLLYIPRGWWYQDLAVLEPSLYLVVSFSNPRGVDVIMRVLEKLSDKEIIRTDIPRFLSADHQSRFITVLQSELMNSIAMAGAVTGVIQPDIQRIFPSHSLSSACSLVGKARTRFPPMDYRLACLARFGSIDRLTSRIAMMTRSTYGITGACFVLIDRLPPSLRARARCRGRPYAS